MRTPTPTHLDPTPCDGSTIECFACGMVIAAVVPLALWAAANPVVAAIAVATAVVALATLTALTRNGESRYGGGEG